MINPILRRAAAGIAVCLVAGACGATGGVVRTLSAVPTKAQVNSAFHAVGGLSGVDITLQIDATAAQLQRMDPTTNARDAALLSHSALNMLVVNAGGGTLSDLKDHPSDLRFELTADVGAGPLVDLVEAHHTLRPGRREPDHVAGEGHRSAGGADQDRIADTAGARPRLREGPAGWPVGLPRPEPAEGSGVRSPDQADAERARHDRHEPAVPLHPVAGPVGHHLGVRPRSDRPPHRHRPPAR